MDHLFRYQKAFDRDPNELDATHDYFRELNRQGKYLTVIRLYQQKEVHYSSGLGADHERRNRIIKQFQYAEQTLQGLELARKSNAANPLPQGQVNWSKVA